MKIKFILLAVISLISVQWIPSSGAISVSASTLTKTSPPHFPIDATESEYLNQLNRNFLQQTGKGFATVLESQTIFRTLPRPIQVGTINLKWLTEINSQLPIQDQIKLTSKETQSKGIPITSPLRYNETIIEGMLDDALQKMPAKMKSVLLGLEPISPIVPDTREVYVEFARKINRVMQLRIRWDTYMPMYQPYLMMRRQMDIRGYYFLENDPLRDVKLTGFNQQDPATQTLLKEYLNGLCFNSKTDFASCDADLQAAIAANSVKQFYDRFVGRSKAVYESFFNLRNARSDIDWTATQPDSLFIPFILPAEKEIEDFLTQNIEDEWKVNNWNLKLNFVKSGPHAQVEFLPNVTPHVNTLGGNVITMSSDLPITEYEVQWTIRHEFGHVLGFPDCYLEFLDGEKGEIISYQIDIQNLMCSRAGHLQTIHYDELKKNYFRNAAN